MPASCDSALTSEMYSEVATRRAWPSIDTMNSGAWRSATGFPSPSTTDTSTSSNSTLDRKTGPWEVFAASPTSQHAVKATDTPTDARIGDLLWKEQLYFNAV